MDERARDPSSSSSSALLRAFLRLPAHQAALLLPPAEEPPATTMLTFVFTAGLRRARTAPLPCDATARPRGDDEVALSLVLRLAVARFGAPHPTASRLGRLAFHLLLRRPRRLAPPPPGAYALRVLLRLPTRLARRLLPPPAGRTSTILAALFYTALHRLQQTLRDQAVDDLLRLLHGINSSRSSAHPPATATVEQLRAALLCAALVRIQRALVRTQPTLARRFLRRSDPADLVRAGLLYVAFAHLRGRLLHRA